MRYKVEVIADASGEWVGNQMTFDTEAKAEAYAIDLAQRWTLVRDWRVVPVKPGKPGRPAPELGAVGRYRTAAQERSDEMRTIDVPLSKNFSPGDKVTVDPAWRRHWSFTGAPAPTKQLWSKLFSEIGVVESVETYGSIMVLDRFGQMHGGAFPVPARFVRSAGRKNWDPRGPELGAKRRQSRVERDLVEFLKFSADDARSIAAEVPAAAGDPEAVDRLLEKVDQKLGAYGVEVVRGPWQGGYYGDAVLLYVNRGDTYDATLVYDTQAETFSVTSWGDWVEQNEASENA